MALICCAVPGRADGQSAPPPPTEVFIAPHDRVVKGNFPPCPTDLEGGRRPVERRGEGWVVHTSDGDREFAEMRSATISPDGQRLAVVFKRGAWFLLVDNRESGPYEDISPPLFSPAGNRLAYYAKRDKRWFAVIDGEEQASITGKFVPWWLVNKIAFSPDSRRVAYVAFTDNDKGHLVVDGQAWPECQNWRGSPVRFSRDSQHVAVACRLPGLFSQTAVFLDGKELARLGEVTSYEFRPGTSELAIFGLRHGTAGDLAILGLGPASGIEPGRKFTRVLTPNGAFGPYFAGPYFSEDGAHVAYSVSDIDQVDLYVDGRSVYYRRGSPSLRSLVLSSDGTRLLAMLLERSRFWIVDLHLGADAAGKWSVLETKEAEALSGADLFLSPSGRHSAYIANHPALRAADNWQAAVLDGQPGPHYDDNICAGLFPRWNAAEDLVYVAGKAGAWYRVTQRVAAEVP